jgi:hypothetical protein
MIAVGALVVRCSPFSAGAQAPESDAGVNSVDAAGASKGFCTSRDASFCADFDEAPDASDGWTGTEITHTGVLSETVTTFVSSPRALSSRVGITGGSARLTWNYPPTAHRTALSFEVQMTRPSPAVDLGFAVAELDCVDLNDSGPTNWSGVWLAAGTEADSGVPNMALTAGDSNFSFPNLPSGWSLVTITVDWGPPSTHIVITVNGVTTLDETSAVACDQKAEAFLFLGSASDSSNEVLYDNVALDVTP